MTEQHTPSLPSGGDVGLIARAKKAVVCIHIAAEKAAADDISAIINDLLAALTASEAERKGERGTLALLAKGAVPVKGSIRNMTDEQIIFWKHGVDDTLAAVAYIIKARCNGGTEAT